MIYVLFSIGDPHHEGDFVGVFSSIDKVMEHVRENFTLNDPQPLRMVKDRILQITHISQWNPKRQFSDLYAYIREVDEV